jgi:hypothetical protein
MNTIEEKVRQAITATAAEITPDSIPPLSLAEPALSRRPVRRGRRWPLRVVAPLAAAAAVAAIIAAAVFGSSGPEGTAGQPTLSPAQRAQLDQEIIGLVTPASAAQYHAGGQFLALYGALTTADFNACMARAGFRLPYHPRGAGNVLPFNPDWPDLALMTRSGHLYPQDPWLPAQPIPPLPGPKLSHARQQAYHDAFDRCIKYRPLMPQQKSIFPILAAWRILAGQVAASAPARVPLAGLRACAQEHGVPASYARSYSRLFVWAGMSDAAHERHRVLVFVTCARAYVANLFRLYQAQQPIFLREHHQQIHAYQELAARQVAALEHKYGIPRI